MPESVYIHIPFCKSRCHYCSFVSGINLEFIPVYTESLIKEISYYYKNETLKTLYFGGGTPSLLPINLLEKLIRIFNIKKGTEITYEINPDDAELDYLKGLKELGINRLSFGSQTFDDKILKIIGRRHSSKKIYEALENAKTAGFRNISLDLIYGLPEQNSSLLKRDLDIIKTLDIQHVSTYGLKIESPSFFKSNPPNNLPNDDMQADMYMIINNNLESAGFKRYEISNFSKFNFESRHNLNYWNNKEYYGFGLSAHGYVDGIRYFNTSNLSKYIKNPVSHNKEHIVTHVEKLEEEIFLGFRKSEGINVAEINEVFNIDFDKKYKDILQKYIPDFISQTPAGYALTIKGVLLSNIILANFISD